MKKNKALRYTGALALGIALYIATPTIDDIATIPLLSYITHIPIYITIILYYGIALLIVLLLEKLIE